MLFSPIGLVSGMVCGWWRFSFFFFSSISKDFFDGFLGGTLCDFILDVWIFCSSLFWHWLKNIDDPPL
jgi:hypothetical protein